MSRVKGGKISSKLAFVRSHYGEAMVQKVLSSMEPADQIDLKIVLDTNWYPFDLYERLMVNICKVGAGGDESVYARIGRYSADQAFANAYKAFLGKDPADLVKKKIVPMHALRNDPAEMEVVSQQDGQCTVRIVKPRSTVEICKVMQAFIARSFELCGGSAVRVRESCCSGKGDPHCQYDVAWEPDQRP
jgi:hypothetical protein